MRAVRCFQQRDVLDLPEQAMDAGDRARATDYLQKVVEAAANTAVQSGFQMSAANVEDAARLAVEVFDQVYQIRQNQPLNVELVSL